MEHLHGHLADGDVAGLVPRRLEQGRRSALTHPQARAPDEPAGPAGTERALESLDQWLGAVHAARDVVADVALQLDGAIAAVPPGRGRAEDIVDGGAFLARGDRLHQMEVHPTSFTLTLRPRLRPPHPAARSGRS